MREPLGGTTTAQEQLPALRTIGVEEELLLVDAETGHPLTRGPGVVDRAPVHVRGTGGETLTRLGPPAGHVASELQLQQVEIVTVPRATLLDLERDLRAWRAAAGAAAEELGARVVATGMSPLPFTPAPTDDRRYAAIMEHFGLTARQQLTCGCHVHVGVASDDEAVAVLDRIRPWLPVLLAISTNSPYCQSEDTGFASFRSQAWARWPTAGPPERFGTARRYHEFVEDLLSTGVLLDRKMVYFDARLSPTFPTVEIRVTDVCLDVQDTVLVAALVRALVDTATKAWASGEDAPDVPTELLRLATWRAGHDGIDGVLLDPYTARPLAATDVLGQLLEHVEPALLEAGDLDFVERQLGAVLRRGTGAWRQRELAADHDLPTVVAHLARATLQ
jgi:carboxylate-amine ligase